MTALSVTDLEPVRDLIMQFRCLADDEHPRRAVWVSAGQGMPLSSAGVPRLRLAAGSLFGSEDCLAELRADPSEECLARILGYVECKSAAASGNADLPVVQALSLAGWVVHEQLVSWGKVRLARRVALFHGSRSRVVSMAACLERRRVMIAEEAAKVRV